MWRTNNGHCKKMQVLWGVVRTTSTLNTYSSECLCTTDTSDYSATATPAHSAGKKSINHPGITHSTATGLCLTN